MPETQQQRDSRGRFVRNITPPPPEEPSQPTPTPEAGPMRLGFWQSAINAAAAPVITDVPVSEQIVNIDSAIQEYTSPEIATPITVQPAPVSNLPLPIRLALPPRYTTEPPLPPPDFNAPGSDESDPQAPSSASQPEDNQHTPILDDNDLSSDDELELQTLPPLQPRPRTPSPPSWRPLPCSHRRLSQPLPPLPLAPQPSATMVQHGVAAMPSARSKTVPYFSGEIDTPIEDFLEEYEELADSCRLTDRQKVETVIRYVNTSQRHIWKTLPSFARHDWDEFCRDLHKEYISPSTQGLYSKQKLVELTNNSARLPMEEQTDVINYHRDFNTLSKPLLAAR